ncbi:MAG TPA: hypothetical protein VEX37_14275 [Thermomicrobiales bacterium]|nr:hypothetical protein [Thermomicrobiales bacterium]
METLLALLFARYERPEALTILRDAEAREREKASLAPQLETAGMPTGMLATSEGENLFVAVLSLRLKFTEDEAREKVALNISMRERGTLRG